jgi:hypothetical protein
MIIYYVGVPRVNSIYKEREVRVMHALSIEGYRVNIPGYKEPVVVRTIFTGSHCRCTNPTCRTQIKKGDLVIYVNDKAFCVDNCTDI